MSDVDANPGRAEAFPLPATEALRAKFMNNPLAAGLYRASVDIGDEMKAQAEQWGGPDLDDMHAPIDWIDLIEVQLDKLASEGGASAEVMKPDYEAGIVRARLVKIAALCMSGIMSIDRLAAREAQGA